MKGLIVQQDPAVAEENMSNLTSASGEASGSSNQQTSFASQNLNPNSAKKKRKLPGNPDPDAEVVALSPKTLLSTNRFVCEICNKGFQRDQNLQLHRRGHNLPWKLRQRSSEAKKKVYICPEATCVHHEHARALGDLTGIKKHFCRKHGEKKWKCDKCSKKYAVQSDWKAHSKTCGTREYRCDCGTLFSRRDSFITHRAFCDALAEESARAMAAAPNPLANHHHPFLFSQATTAPHDASPPPAPASLQSQFPSTSIAMINSRGLHDLTLKREQQQQQQQQGFDVVRPEMPPWLASQAPGPGPPAPPPPSLTHNLDLPPSLFPARAGEHGFSVQENPSPSPPLPPHMSATALLQKAAQMGSNISRPSDHNMAVAHRVSSAGAAASGAASFGLGLLSHQEIMGSFGAASPAPMVQSVVMGSFSRASGYEGSFEEALGGMLAARREVSSDGVDSLAGRNEGGGGGGLAAAAAVGGGADGLTRDFLGLRALSHRDLLSMAGLEPCMSSTTSYEQPQQSKKPWN